MSVSQQIPGSSTSGRGSEAARQYWELWQNGAVPDLRKFIAEKGTLSPNQLAGILCVDLRERWRRKERVSAEDYLKQFPELAADHEAALDVVYCEFLIRDELGEAPDKAEYSQRFPDLSVDLSRQIEMHRLLQSGNGESDFDKVTMLDTKDRGDKPEQAFPLLPGFEILGRVGRGGMGVVYKAWQDRLYRVVAVKMLQAADADDAAALARFRVEGEAIARLQHPNIVQIYEVGEHEGRPFLVMEFADSGNLAQKMKGTPWPAREAAEMVETLARAVHYAHGRGVVHRDLTPSNVLLFAGDVPKLSDFGLAKLLVGGRTLTQTGDVMGTPSYMSPEQASGTSRETGPSADIYALGAILYELLTGRPPFRGASALETLAQVVHNDPAAPRQLQPGVPRDLETICLKCLRKEPARRYASAAELADDLRHFLKNEPIQARAVGSLERLWRWGWRNPGWAAALLLLMLSAVGAFIASGLLAKGLSDSRKAHAQTKRAEREALQKLYRSTIDEAKAKRLSGRVGQRAVSLASIAEAKTLAEKLDLPAADLHEMRNEVVACLALPDIQPVFECDAFPEGSIGLDFDDVLLAYARSDLKGNISLRRMKGDAAKTNSEIASFSTGYGDPVLPRFSPDSHSLAAFSGKRLTLWRFDPLWQVDLDEQFQFKKGLDVPIEPGEMAESRFAYGMMGKQIAVLHGDGSTVSVFDTKTAVELYRGQPAASIAKLAMHPNQEVLALAAAKEAILFDLQTKQAAMKLAHPDKVCGLAFGQEGRLLITACEDKSMRVWEVSDRKLPFIPLGFKDAIAEIKMPISKQPGRLVGQFQYHNNPAGFGMAVNHNASLLATSNAYGTLRLWDLRGGQQLIMPLAEGGHFRFSGVEEALGCTAPGGKARVYRTILGREFRRLPQYQRHGSVGARNVIFHPSGRLLFASGEDGLNVINVRSATAYAAPAGGRWAVPVGFDANGGLITDSAEGYQLWPSLAPPPQPKLIRAGPQQYGPPQLLAPGGNAQRAVFGGDGKILVVAEKDRGARIIRLDDAGKVIHLGPHKDVRYCAVSPDGRFVATGTSQAPGDPGAIVWDATNGQRVRDIPATPRLCDVDFSPDGRWLITSGGGCQLWEVGTWTPGPTLGGNAFAFAPDGKVLAVEAGDGQVRLVQPDTGAELVRLTANSEMMALPCCFSPDGSMLVVFGTESQSLHVWDLRAVRAYLETMGLNWDQPPYPSAGQMPGPGRVELIVK